jgi:hypothetical protein
MPWPPNDRERAQAHAAIDPTDFITETVVAQLLANYREELLRPFEELRRDYEVLGDKRVERELDDLIRTARGRP